MLRLFAHLPKFVLILALLMAACAPAPLPTDPPSTAAPQSTIPIPSTATPVPSAIFQPKQSATPPGCTDNLGAVERVTFETGRTTDPMQVRVYTPPCYDPGSGPYPFLVMLHGQTYTDDQWDRLGIDEQADALISAGEAPPFLIFMPLEKNTLLEPDQSNYDALIADGLLPWIERAYPVCAERTCRALGGLSRGAAWAVRIGFIRPELFGSVGAHSLTPFLNDAYRLPYWLMRARLPDLPRFYLDIGDQDDLLSSAVEFKNVMTKQGVAFEWQVSPGSHAETYWQAHVREYLEWYVQPWLQPLRK